jgi:hypothetical protein
MVLYLTDRGRPKSGRAGGGLALAMPAILKEPFESPATTWPDVQICRV